uniref:Ferritin n=1 Tax=Steinernema glaseri TaxID=37863 RepID=A0A1I8ALR5_9BILA
MKQSMEEKQHADKLMEYQVRRGGRVVLHNVMKPQKQEWENLELAFRTALELERANNTALLELHSVVDSKSDPDCRNFLQKNYLREQVNEIENMARRLNHCRRVGGGLGEYMYDRELLEKAKQ